MAINRSLMERQLRMGGGIMNAMPRQQYGLGSFVKKAVKGVTGAAKSAVKGITGAIKDNPALALAALNFAPMLAGGKPFFGLGLTEGRIGLPSFLSTGVDKFSKMSDIGKAATVFAGGSLLGGVLGQAEEQGDPEGITRNVGALRSKLADAYRNQRTFSDEEDEESAIAQQVERDVSEYTAGPGYTNVQQSGSFASGGRVGFAMGSPEQNAIEAAGIMNLPLNQNPAGVTELDLRETGGFIPPVGVKEKADDIPAMLANNEFVFTADAVRGMGDGNVNKGAQRMYDMMKKLEKGGRVA
jgi:hypothetical protein